MQIRNCQNFFKQNLAEKYFAEENECPGIGDLEVAAEPLLPADLRRFIARHICSVEQLEILCLVVENTSRSWLAPEIFRQIQSSLESVSGSLKYFSEAGLLVGDESGGFRFSSDETEATQLARRLVKIYRQKRVTVIEAIYSIPVDPIQTFADAFKLKKDKP